jgi:ABC-type nickel/cobalt efflux system permease component RcnA
MHALAPGHGKTLMAATAAARGGRARMRDVLPLAASVTVTHTLGVVALGLLVTAGSAAAPSVIAWLGVSSGVLVTIAGTTLLRRAWRNRPPGHGHDHAHDHDHDHDEHTHEHGHPHDHPHKPVRGHDHGRTPDHDHDHDHAPDHPHDHEHTPSHRHSHDGDHAHNHDHTHDGDHEPAGAPHRHADHPVRPLVLAHATASVTTSTPTATAPRPHTHPAPAPHPHDHSHDHDHDHRPGGIRRSSTLEHTHGGFTHTHEIAPTIRGTILLGFAGGLVPSPSAVVVLVGATALGQAWFGLLLVLAYGVGLALTLTAAGFAVVRLGGGMTRVLARRPRWAEAPLVLLVRRTAPLGSALIVVALGAGLVLRGAASVLG